MMERQKPGCETCIYRNECTWAKDGQFCTLWRSQEPDKREPNPNDLWERGEEVDF